MYEGVDTVVLYSELAYEDVIPVNWRVLNSPPAPEVHAHSADRNLRLLQACAALEEAGPTERSDDNAAHADMLRLDLKLNLLLDLVGRLLLVNQPRPKGVPLRFNARGASWQLLEAGPKPGDEGELEIYLNDFLVEPLRLYGRVANLTAEGRIGVKFHDSGEAISDLIEKLAFRRHRRQVADSRQPRSFDPSRTGRFRR
jgi:hypothetical protein